LFLLLCAFFVVGSNAEVNLIYCIYAAFAAFLPPAGHQAKSLGGVGEEGAEKERTRKGKPPSKIAASTSFISFPAN